jgi:uncharacterized protein
VSPSDAKGRASLAWRVALGWLIALLGVAVWQGLGGPLPWLLGAMLAVALARACGLPLAEWAWGRALGQLFIGVGLGLNFTPTVMAELADRWPLVLGVAFLALWPGALGAWAYQRWAGLSRPAAWLCALPGGASEMAVLAPRYGVAPSVVALTQGLRVALVVSVVPGLLLLWSGMPGRPPELSWARQLWSAGFEAFHVPEFSVPEAWALAPLAGLLLAGSVLARWGQKRNWPNVWLMAPLCVSAAASAWPGVSAAAHAHMPAVCMDLAQALLGIGLGSKLDAHAWRQAPRLSLVAAAVVLGAVIGSGGIALALAWLAGGLPVTHHLALAPGGMAEMALLARQMQAHLPEVIAAHVLRLFLVLSLTPWWLARIRV